MRMIALAILLGIIGIRRSILAAADLTSRPEYKFGKFENGICIAVFVAFWVCFAMGW